MKYLVSRVMTIDPGDDVTEEELKEGFKDEDNTSVNMVAETGYNEQGRVIAYEILTIETKVVSMEETPLPTVTVGEVPSTELTPQGDGEDGAL
jgi:hypothetical protein